MLSLNDLLVSEQIDPSQVLIFRHRPYETQLKKRLPWLAAEKPHLFNAYQQTHGEKVERAMEKMAGTGYVASFIGHEPGKALFVGIYLIESYRPLTYDQYWAMPENQELKNLGMVGFTEEESRSSINWFDLKLLDQCQSVKGKLVVHWPPPERSWWRRAQNNDMRITSIFEENMLEAVMQPWDEMSFTWDDLGILPTRLRNMLSEWRGIYYIFDVSDGLGYVGSACGESNLLGRWTDYAASGHGGNKLLRQRDPKNFRFTILQRVSPDMELSDIVRIENSWKKRLHTVTDGLNEN